MNNRIQIEREARVHLTRGEWDMAIAAYRNLLDANGENPNVYNLIGDVYVKMGDLDAAFKEYLQAIHLYTKEGLFENGVAICKKVLRFKKDEPEIYFRLAEFYAKLGFGSDALNVLITYSKKEHNLGQIKKSIKRYKEVISLILTNKKLLPRVKEVCSELGYKPEELDELLKDVPSHERNIEIPRQKQEIEHIKSEIKSSSEKLATERENLSSKENVGFLSKVINETKDALANGFCTASPIRTDPVDDRMACGDVAKGKSHYELGMIYKKLGFYEQAIEELQQATRDSNHRFDAFKLLGLCFFENGEPESAINAFTRGLKEDGDGKDYAELHYWLGRAYELIEDNQKAINEFEQAYALDIKHRDVQDRLKKLKGKSHAINK